MMALGSGAMSSATVSVAVLVAALFLVALAVTSCRVRRESEPAPTETEPVVSASAIDRSAAPPPPPPPPPPPVEAPPGALVFAIGGIDSSPEQSDVVEQAVDTATQALVSGATTLDAAVAGVVVLEDEPSLNAGTGSHLPLDAERPRMDAAVMDSQGRFGAVCVVEDVKNPVAVAARVVETPHLLLCGAGAVAFARAAGFSGYDTTTEARRRQRDDLVAELVGTTGSPFGDFLLRARERDDGAGGSASKPAPVSSAVQVDGGGGAGDAPRTGGVAGGSPAPAADTVAVVVRSADGGFAVAASSGGPAASFGGRVGDVPILGAAVFAGPSGAVALSGRGEDILRAQFARRIYERLDAGDGEDAAAAWALDLVGDDEAIAIVIVGRKGHRLDVTRPVAWALRNAEGVRTGAPEPPPPAATTVPADATGAPDITTPTAGAPPPVAPNPAPPPAAPPDTSAEAEKGGGP